MTPPHNNTTPRNRWDDDALRDPHARADKAARVETMFDAIAPTYERVNSIVSLGRDSAWRRRAIAAARITPDDIALDVCCGTGDMIRALAAHAPAPKQIVGVDFAADMLAGGRYDGCATPIQLIRGDGLRLPLVDRSVDVITCAFGVRNYQDLSGGLHEMFRVLRSGGRVVILEFALPENALLRWGYRVYCERILPRVGAVVSRDKTGAYRYLPSSIRTFERRGAMLARLGDAGFMNLTAEPLNLGGVVIYRGEKEENCA